MAKSPSRDTDLLAAIRRQLPKAQAPEPPVVQPPAQVTATRSRGRAVQFWLHDEDIKLIRELAAYLSSQGLRSTDSLIVRSALRLTPTDASLLEQFRAMQALDGRRRPETTQST